MHKLHSNGLYLEQARSQQVTAQGIDMHKVVKSGNMPETPNMSAKDMSTSMLDIASWLPYAAEAYNISASLQDFVVVPVTIFYSDLPNSNMTAFPFEDLTAWNPNAGQVTYKSWKGKPTHLEHANDDFSIAKGVIFDAAMRKVPEYAGDLYRVVLLTGWDRTRDPELANNIAKGPYGFSMGAWVSDYTCSVCNASFREGACQHIHPKHGVLQPIVDKVLTYRKAHGVTGFELSAVKVPAFRQAIGTPIG